MHSFSRITEHASVDRRLVEQLAILFNDDALLEGWQNAPGVTLEQQLERSGYSLAPLPSGTEVSALRNGHTLVARDGDLRYVMRRRGLKTSLFTIEDSGAAKEKKLLLPQLLRKTPTEEWFLVVQKQNLDAISSPKHDLNPWRRLLGLAKFERRDILAVVLYSITLGLLSLLIPVATQALVNTIAFGAILQPLIVFILALGVGLGVAAFLSVIQMYIVEVLQRRYLVRIAQDFGERYMRISHQARDQHHLVELNNRFFDVISIQKSASELLLTGLALALQIIAGLLLLGVYHPVLFAFAIFLIVATIGIILLGRGGTESAIQESKAKFKVAAWLDVLASSPEQFSGGRQRDFGVAELQRRTLHYVSARKSHFSRVFRIMIGGATLQVLSVIALLGIGGILVINKQLNLGQLVASEIVIGAIAVGLGKIGRLADKSFDLVAATDKIGKILDLPIKTPGYNRLPAGISLAIEGKGVAAGYGDKQILQPQTFAFDAGDKVWLDASSGTGSTLFLEVLAGIREPMAGEIRWDGRQHLTEDDRSQAIWYLSEPLIMPLSVLDNLRLGAPQLLEVDAWSLLACVGLDGVIDKIGGLDAQLSESGAPLSPSQRRRLMIAMTIAAQPRLIVIDHMLDQASNHEDTQCSLCELLLGEDTTWTAVVATKSPVVKGYLTKSMALDNDPEIEETDS